MTSSSFKPGYYIKAGEGDYENRKEGRKQGRKEGRKEGVGKRGVS